jgi:hypothetical protein
MMWNMYYNQLVILDGVSDTNSTVICLQDFGALVPN